MYLHSGPEILPSHRYRVLAGARDVETEWSVETRACGAPV